MSSRVNNSSYNNQTAASLISYAWFQNRVQFTVRSTIPSSTKMNSSGIFVPWLLLLWLSCSICGAWAQSALPVYNCCFPLRLDFTFSKYISVLGFVCPFGPPLCILAKSSKVGSRPNRASVKGRLPAQPSFSAVPI